MGFTARVKQYVGFDDKAPRSIDTVDWVRSHKGDVKEDVSETRAIGEGCTDAQVVTYVKSLFPFIQWVPRYNFTWLYGDLVA